MGGYLPQVFERFGSDYPAVMEAFRELAERLHEAGPLSARERRREAIRHVALLGITTGGYPAAMAALGWINEVLDREDRTASA